MELLQNLNTNSQQDPKGTVRERLNQVAGAVVAQLPLMVQGTAQVFLNSFLQLDADETKIIDGLEQCRQLLDYIEYGTEME